MSFLGLYHQKKIHFLPLASLFSSMIQIVVPASFWHEKEEAEQGENAVGAGGFWMGKQWKIAAFQSKLFLPQVY